MNLSVFLEVVEIKTKLASLFPFLTGILFSLYYFEAFDALNTLLFFAAMILFDMATTAINNTMDYVKAKNETYRRETNVLGRAGLSVRKMAVMIVGMVAAAAVLGLLLVYRTNLLLLVLGVVCFAIGIGYTFGPFPISRMPLGEVMSGFTMGFGIFFIAVFINTPLNSLAAFRLSWPVFAVEGNLENLLVVALTSLPLVFSIANIMLANNICDYEVDVTNHRYTLVHYVGRAAAVRLYGVLYYLNFAVITLLVLSGVLPGVLLGIWLAFLPLERNIRLFRREQNKATTFHLTIQNLVIFHGLEIALLLLALWLKG